MTTKKIENFFTSRGVKPVCEVCGQNTWSLPQDENPMVVKLATETLVPPPMMPNVFAQQGAPGGAIGQVLRSPDNPFAGGVGAVGLPVPQYGTLNAYAIVCMNCGNIRFHAELVVKPAAGL